MILDGFKSKNVMKQFHKSLKSSVVNSNKIEKVFIVC